VRPGCPALKLIEQVHRDSRGTYGSPRVHAELTLGLGPPVNLKRVARLMRQAGLQGLYRRRRRGCTVRDPAAEPASDLIQRNFTADRPNRLWITDITESPTDGGKLYCAAVMDAYSRLIVGWSIAPHMRTELVTDGLGMAIVLANRRTDRKTRGRSCILKRDAIYFLGVRATTARRRAARLNGHRWRLLRQCGDGIVLGTSQLELLDTKECRPERSLPTPYSNG
jgi:putative transposase